MRDNLRLFAARGAACCDNTSQSIQEAAASLYSEILKRNGIEEAEIVSIQFTVTADLTAINPATALRREGLALDSPLFVSLEPQVENSLPRTIRVMITFYGSEKPCPVYIRGAEALRPDLTLTGNRL